jgi:hypothetical protein
MEDKVNITALVRFTSAVFIFPHRCLVRGALYFFYLFYNIVSTYPSPHYGNGFYDTINNDCGQGTKYYGHHQQL